MRTRVTLIALSVLLGLVLYVLVNKAVGNVDKGINKQLLQDLVCAFPCWQNITPQESNFESVIPIMQQNKEIKINFITKDSISFLLNNVSGVVSAAVDGKVDHIILTVENIQLNDFVQITGLPAKVAILQIPNVPESCEVSLLFPETGAILNLNLEKINHINFDCQVNIDANSKIFRIILLAKNFNGSQFWKTSTYSDLDYIEWKGYGEYP